MLISIHPSLAIADLMRDLKSSSSKWIRQERIVEPFGGWQDGYGIFTADWQRKDSLIEYIKNQEEHHRKVSFLEEYRGFVEEAGLIWMPEYDG